MTLDIRSGEGVSPLQFGMGIRNARAALAKPLLDMTFVRRSRGRPLSARGSS